MTVEVQEAMTRQVVSVQADDSLSQVKKIFDSARFHHLLVVERERLVGVISDRDLLECLSPYLGHVSETSRDRATLNRRAHQIMTRNPTTTTPDTDIRQAVALLLESKGGCLPVIDEDERPLGIVTWRDLLRAVAEHDPPDGNA